MPNKKKIFVSFDYDNDKRYKYLLQAWDANPDFDFYFNDMTPDEINTWDIGRIKASLTRQINSATHTLIIIGQYANSLHPKHQEIGYRNWINFEIAKSKEARNKIVGIKLDASYSSPVELLNSGASWAMSFTRDEIIKALKEI
jgi:hypothetical protein